MSATVDRFLRYVPPAGRVVDGHIEMTLKRGVIRFDASDLPLVSSWRWSISGKRRGYAYGEKVLTTKAKRVRVLMHRLILGALDGEQVDHKNGDGLDNRRENLRFCSRSQNCANKPKYVGNASRFKGVIYHRQTGKWRAVVTVQYKAVSLGLHATEELAARAYDAGAKKHFGEFANLNFPEVSHF
jgi:hypothetical protein